MRAGSEINTLAHSQKSLGEKNIKQRHFRKQSMPDPAGQKEEHPVPLERIYTPIKKEIKKKTADMMEGEWTLTQRGFLSSEKVSPIQAKVTSLRSSPMRRSRNKTRVVSTLGNNSLQ